jgi:hypothetical protein
MSRSSGRGWDTARALFRRRFPAKNGVGGTRARFPHACPGPILRVADHTSAYPANPFPVKMLPEIFAAPAMVPRMKGGVINLSFGAGFQLPQ